MNSALQVRQDSYKFILILKLALLLITVKKFTNETEWKDLPVVLQKQKTEDPSSLNTKVPDQNQLAAERLSIKASPEEVCELKASSSLQMHSQVFCCAATGDIKCS